MSKDKQFLIKYDVLPPSVNQYLKPASRQVGGKHIGYMYESQEAKDFKFRFQAYLKREVKRVGWDKDITEDGHWLLECVFVQSRTNQDNNNCYKILCDSLKDIVIADDKNILVQTKKVLYDAKNPRFYAMLRRADYIGIFDSDKDYEEFQNHNCLSCKKDKSKCSILKKAVEGRISEDITNIEGIKVCTKKR